MEVRLQPLEGNTQAVQQEASSKVKRQELTDKSEESEGAQNKDDQKTQPLDSISSPNPDPIESNATPGCSPAPAAPNLDGNNAVNSNIVSNPDPSSVSKTDGPAPGAVDGNDATGAGPPSKVVKKQVEQIWWPCVIGTVDRASKSVRQTRWHIFCSHKS